MRKRYAIIRGGEWFGIRQCEESQASAGARPGDSIIEIADAIGTDTYYWDGTGFEIRSVLAPSLDVSSIPPDGVTVATLSGVPSGAAVVMVSEAGVVESTADGSDIEVTSDLPGDQIIISVAHPEYTEHGPLRLAVDED